MAMGKQVGGGGAGAKSGPKGGAERVGASNIRGQSMPCLESVLVERLEPPEQVGEFGHFEELSKLYAIEQPFVARTQIELLFDVYDGHKLRSSGSLDADQTDQANEQLDSNNNNNNNEPTTAGRRFSSCARRGSQFVGADNAATNNVRTSSGSMLSVWFRLLFAGRAGRQAARSALASAACCLAPSDTHQELGGLVSASSSVQCVVDLGARSGQQKGRPECAGGSAAAAATTTMVSQQARGTAGLDDDDDDDELRRDAGQLVASARDPALTSGLLLQRSQFEMLASGGAGGQLALDCNFGNTFDTTRAVSICLLARRHLGSRGGAGAQGIEDKVARNGRQWARASAHLLNLRRKLRESRLHGSNDGANTKTIKRNAAAGKQQQSANNNNNSNERRRQRRRFACQLDWVAKRASHKYWLELKHDWTRIQLLPKHYGRRRARQKQRRWHENDPNAFAMQQLGARERAKHLDELVELVKCSLNQLIDAQLLLRNKLTGTSEQPSSLLAKSEYETLLRNNFNLLKIWQNLEETKRLACFVCEPIKATLSDLFWFNRQRQDWPSWQLAFEATNLNLATSVQAASPLASNSKCLLLVSPLVCLDGVQVKRGLLQILEALNFLHGICKLIHRNVTPRNILIGNQDNWKLSGLEFAIRFESTTISESSSMMAHELSSAAARFGAPGAGSSSASSQHQLLRRQRTLHQTKCQEFIRRHKCPLLQPDLDYLAPEIWKSSKCSHKSDIFSFGLVLGQTYDLCSHRAPLNCRSEPSNYELELKKLGERRRAKLARLVPFEMRQGLLETLECEPNLRPSANYLLQLFKRPIELCRANEDSLRHLKSTLNYLDSRFSLGHHYYQQTALMAAGAHYHGSQQNISTTAGQQQQQQKQKQRPSSRQATAPVKASSYFRRVTSVQAQRDAHKRQTKSLRLLNLLVRALDSAGVQASQQRAEALTELYATPRAAPIQQASAATTTAAPGPEACGSSMAAGSGSANRRASFGTLWLQFEQTLESLCQVYRVSALTMGALACGPAFGFGQRAAAGAAAAGPAKMCPADSRSLLLIVALHRRLLEQVALMRAELPPVARLLALDKPDERLACGAPCPTMPGQGANHRALADAEDKLVWLVNKHSVARLAETLADPLLKLDEFLLVFELLNDLIAFVGQKCKQNFAQRGKQLLIDLTPVTGAPLLSSSEEDDDDDDNSDEALAVRRALGYAPAATDDNGIGLGEPYPSKQAITSGGRRATAATRSSVAAISKSQLNLSSGGLTQANQAQVSKMNQPQHNQQHRFSDHEAYLERASGRASVASTSLASAGSSRAPSRQQQQQQHFQLPTSINITAPSPLGSVRDISSSRVSSADSQQLEAQLAAVARVNQCKQQQRRQQDEHNALSQMASQMSLAGGPKRPNARASTSGHHQSGDQQDQNESQDADTASGGGGGAETATVDDKSRSQLIDELLRTINDDSFNEYIDFNNKLAAATRTQSNQADSERLFEQQPQQRPRSAIDGSSPTRNQAWSPGGARPRTLNIGTAAAAAATAGPNAASQARSASGRSSVCVPSSSSNQQQQQGSAFDNVLRRMSTNLVQNFANKMSSSTQLAAASTDRPTSGMPLDSTNNNQICSQSELGGTSLRREKSSTSTNAAYANSLYVDNQVPARRHSDNTINVPRIQVALSSPQASGSRTNLNQRASVSATKLANKWKTTAKSNQREASDKLSPNLGDALNYMRRHSSGNTTDKNNQSDQNQSNGLGAQLLNVSPFKKKQEAKSSSNLGLDFLLSNRSMKRRYSAASMLGHQTQRKAEDLIDAGMKSVQNMFG